MDWAPITRIVLRYALGFFAAKNILPSELTDMITSDPESLQQLQLGVAAGGVAVVEGVYTIARKRGWTL